MNNFARMAALLALVGAWGVSPMASAGTSPDYAALTREFYVALDRGDVASAGRFLCSRAVAISPRGLVSTRDQLLRRMSPRPAETNVRRDWGALSAQNLGASTLVTGEVTLRSTQNSAQSQSMVSVHWTSEADRPCVSVYQRMISGEAAEAAFWNEAFILGEGFNLKPNAWLVKVAGDLKPGRALDVAMGQGRNAVWLASQGWDVTGYDIAGEGLKIAREAAAAQKTKVNTVLASTADFDFGRDQWDLVAIIYAGGREGELLRAAQGLKRGGVVVLEGFFGQPEAGQPASGVTFDRAYLEKAVQDAGLELVELQAPADGRPDYGTSQMRPVRLLARKP